MAERVLTQRDLNRAVLARQGLLEPMRAPIPTVLERIGGIQAQYAPSMYVGLWSRMADLRREELTRALERRAVVQATLMRLTIHLVSRRDFWPLALATRAARRDLWLRARRDVEAADMEAAARALRDRLRDGPLRRAQAEAIVGKGRFGGVGQWLELVRVPPSGTWERRRADLFAAAEDWVGAPAAGEQDAVRTVVHRYLAGFGPAPVADIANWAGLPIRALAPTLETMALRRMRSADGTELVDLPRAPLPGGDAPAPVRFLPTWDATLLANVRRAGILPEEHRPRIFSAKTPHSFPTFLVDGAVAGTWRFQDGRVDLEPFGRLDAATRRALAEAAERLAEFHR